MKKFARFSLLAAVMILVAVVASLLMVTTTAASTVKTIYIAETALGKGDGSSAANAMGSVEEIAPSVPDSANLWEKYTEKQYYKNSALYRAAAQLASTGGKIVLVGDVSIDFSKTCAGEIKEDGTVTSRQTSRDFNMPTYGNNEITITNESYNANLILTEGAMMILGGNTVFEDLNIVTHDGTATESGAQKGYTICCNGYKTVFGEGITSTSYSGNYKATGYTKRTANTNNKDYFITIAGGTRYGISSRGADITVKSGIWNILNGGNRGNGGHEQFGDVNLKVEGGTFLGAIVGGGSWYAAVTTFGNVDINISGGTFYGNIYAAGRSKLGYENNKAKVTISGGLFSNSNTINECYSASYDIPLSVDVSACTLANSKINTLLSKIGDSEIVYPAKWVTSATVKSFSEIAFKGEAYDADSVVFSVSYTNGKTGEVAYNPNNTSMSVTLDTTTEGKKAMSWKCGGATGTKEVSVLSVPAPVFEGAQVATESGNLGKLRFVAHTSMELSSGVALKESGESPYGFIAYVNTPNTTSMDIDMTEIRNATIAKGEIFRSDIDKYGLYNNDKLRTFSAEFKDLSVKDYNSTISVVAYLKFTYNGKEYVRYSDVATKTVLGVANAAYASELESDAGKAFVKTNIIDKYAAYTANKAAMVDSASADAMRNQVVSAFKAMANYQWTPSETFTLNAGNKTNTYTAGTTYKGIPYINNRKATLSEFTANITTVSGTNGSTNLYTGPIRGIYEIFGVPNYDANGVFTGFTGGIYNSTSFAKNLTDGKKVEDYATEDMLYISNSFPATDYSAIYNAWNVVGTNEVWPVGLAGAIPGRSSGVVAVGGYKYSGTDTKAMCESNGTAVMYAAYAACKPGDVLVNYSSSGRSLHMVTTASNGTAAATTTLKRSYTTDTMKNNSHFVLDSSVSFESLYNSGFIPVTIPELQNGLKTPTTALLSGFDGEKSFEIGKVVGIIESNRTIVSVNVTIGVGNNYVYEKTNYYTTEDTDKNRVDLSEFNFSTMKPYLAAGKAYTLKVTAEIAGNASKTVLAECNYTMPANDLTKYAAVFTGSNTPILKLPADLKQAASDYMWTQYNATEWTPSHSFKYYDTNTESEAFCPSSIYEAGVTYRGTLYADMRATLAEFKKTLTKNNVLNIDTTLELKNGYYQVDWSKIMGNHCSAGMFHAYQQSSRVSAGYGSRANPDFKSVGVEDIYGNFAKNMVGHTISAVKAYGCYAMYESYAKWQVGDYMYNTGDGGGHTRMVSEVVVVRDAATGMIDPDRSYVLLNEQTDTLISDRIDTNKYNLYVATNENGTTYMQFIKKTDTTTIKPTNGKVYTKFSDFYKDYGFDTTWWLNNKYSFRTLGGTSSYYAVGYRPLEYITNVGEDRYVGINQTPTFTELCNAATATPTVIETNYPLVSTFARITNTKTGEFTDVYGFRAKTNEYRYDLSNMAANLTTAVSGLASGSYKISVIAELAVGEVEVLSYNYTK